MKKILLFILILVTAKAGFPQITILNTNLNSLNITAQSICQVNIMNGTGSETQVILEAKLLNSANENLLTVKTNPFPLATGMNNGITLNYTIQSSAYGISGQAEYLRTSHILPSGNFKYCVSVVALASDAGGDDYCEDIVSDISAFLMLIYPNDKDTIETLNPVLTWTHSEPFNILSPGDHFKLVLVELNKDQPAESGVTVNIPVYYKDFLSVHQLLYPVDAKNLEQGKRYGWQVQKISNGTIIDKTEAWEFTLKNNIVKPDNKYATLKKKHDGSYYTAENEKIFFRFIENYSGGELRCRIFDNRHHEIKPEVINEKSVKQQSGINVTGSGSNYYQIDLQQLRLKPGFYELEVVNVKNEKYVLKFYVEK